MVRMSGAGFPGAGVALLLVVAVVGCTGGPPAAPELPTPPNILYILADDLGYGEVGAYGQEIIETPHIDALARRRRALHPALLRGAGLRAGPRGHPHGPAHRARLGPGQRRDGRPRRRVGLREDG